MVYAGLDGKVAVVTGAPGGLGSATVHRLCEEGVKVIAVDLNEDRAKQTAAESPGLAIGVGADVSTEEGVERYLREALKVFRRVDFHLLNAGITGSAGQFVDLSVDEWYWVLAVNFRGPFLGTRAAFRHFLAGGTTGSIVVTASTAGLRGSSDLIAYAPSKHGVIGLVRGAAVYVGPIGVRVNGIVPGIVPTQIFGAANKSDMDPPGRDLSAAPGGHARRDSRAGCVPLQRRRRLCHRRGSVCGRRSQRPEHEPAIGWRRALRRRRHRRGDSQGSSTRTRHRRSGRRRRALGCSIDLRRLQPVREAPAATLTVSVWANMVPIRNAQSPSSVMSVISYLEAYPHGVASRPNKVSD